jgi:hypothetical protein
MPNLYDNQTSSCSTLDSTEVDVSGPLMRLRQRRLLPEGVD